MCPRISGRTTGSRHILLLILFFAVGTALSSSSTVQDRPTLLPHPSATFHSRGSAASSTDSVASQFRAGSLGSRDKERERDMAGKGTADAADLAGGRRILVTGGSGKFYFRKDVIQMDRQR